MATISASRAHEHAGEVLALVEDRRVGGPHQVDAHLADDRDERLPHDLQGDGITLRRRSRLAPVAGCRSRRRPRQPGKTTVVEPNSSTIAGPCEPAPLRQPLPLVDRTGREPPSNHTGRVSTSASSSRRLSLRWRASGGLGDDAEGGEPDVDHLDRALVVGVAVGLPVGRVEGLATPRRRMRARARPAGSARTPGPRSEVEGDGRSACRPGANPSSLELPGRVAPPAPRTSAPERRGSRRSSRARWVRTASCLMSEAATPSAEKLPGKRGTRTRVMPSSSAIGMACMPPGPAERHQGEIARDRGRAGS